MKTYCKNIDITNFKEILSSVIICLNRPKNKRRKSFQQLVLKYNGAEGIAREICNRIQTKDLQLEPIQYKNRRDASSGKMRRIGIETPLQQCMDYVAVNALIPLFKTKIGLFQCASMPKRGQSFGRKFLEQWIRYDQTGTKYYDKMDIKHCFENISWDVIESLLKRDIHKNSVLIWFIMSLIKTFEKGLSIGSYLSQWLCNYVISYAYHYITEWLYCYRREKRINYVNHVLIYMDDIILFSSSKKHLAMASKQLTKYLLNTFNLTIKPNHHIKHVDTEPVDMMGFVIGRTHTEIRASTFVRARRALIRARRRMAQHLPIGLQNARRIIAYNGYFVQTNSRTICEKLELAKILKRAKAIVGSYDSTMAKLPTQSNAT